MVLSLDPGTSGGSPRLFLGFQKIKNDLHNNSKILFAFFFIALTFSFIVPKALVGEIPGTSVGLKAVTPTCTGCVLCSLLLWTCC